MSNAVLHPVEVAVHYPQLHYKRFLTSLLIPISRCNQLSADIIRKFSTLDRGRRKPQCLRY